MARIKRRGQRLAADMQTLLRRAARVPDAPNGVRGESGVDLMLVNASARRQSVAAVALRQAAERDPR